MTEKLYYGNQYQTEGTATVLACRPVEAKQNAAACWEVVLDRTVFYPTGGGQPCDLGTLNGVPVTDVSERGEEIVHRVTAPLSVGSEAVMAVDWDRRFDLMQQHSGEHLISGVIHSRFGYENVGFHMGA